MAGVAEKARFYLERSVPQLREWEEKDVFGKEEIRTIVKKRNDFEYKVLSPGNLPSEWSSYAQWEQSLETLRRKRCKRLKIRHLNSAHVGQGRVLGIYERAVNRHPGNGLLWRQYLSYTEDIKAAKRWRRTMTNALRMMPTDPELWIIAGQRSSRNGDMTAARGFFMRGCRFCNTDRSLWIEYARCEMEWLQKMEKKMRKGTTTTKSLEQNDDVSEMRLIESDEEDDEDSGLLLPEPNMAQAKVINKQATQQLVSNPALDGAIPIAIFDVCQKQEFFNEQTAEDFFEMFASFKELSVESKVSLHVLDTMEQKYPNHPCTCSCRVRQPIIGLSPYTTEFPRALREVLTRLPENLEKTTSKEELKTKTVEWIDQYLEFEDLDEGIRAVFDHTKKTLAMS